MTPISYGPYDIRFILHWWYPFFVHPLFCTLPPFLYTFLRNLCFTSGPLFSTIPTNIMNYTNLCFIQEKYGMWVCKVVQLRGSLVKRVDVVDIMLVTKKIIIWRQNTRIDDRFWMLETLNRSKRRFSVGKCQLWSKIHMDFWWLNSLALTLIGGSSPTLIHNPWP